MFKLAIFERLKQFLFWDELKIVEGDTKFKSGVLEGRFCFDLGDQSGTRWSLAFSFSSRKAHLFVNVQLSIVEKRAGFDISHYII